MVNDTSLASISKMEISIFYLFYFDGFFDRDPDDPYKLTQDTRHLGLVVCRGTAVTLICPMDGMESIANPFVSQE